MYRVIPSRAFYYLWFYVCLLWKDPHKDTQVGIQGVDKLGKRLTPSMSYEQDLLLSLFRWQILKNSTQNLGIEKSF